MKKLDLVLSTLCFICMLLLCGFAIWYGLHGNLAKALGTAISAGGCGVCWSSNFFRWERTGHILALVGFLMTFAGLFI